MEQLKPAPAEAVARVVMVLRMHLDELGVQSLVDKQLRLEERVSTDVAQQLAVARRWNGNHGVWISSL